MSATDDQIAEALKAAVNAQLGGAKALDADEYVQADGTVLRTRHVQFALEQTQTLLRRGGYSSSGRGYRVQTRVVDSSVSNVRETQRRVSAALRDAQVPIEGRRTTPIDLETQDAPTPDSGMYAALTTWTFTY